MPEAVVLDTDLGTLGKEVGSGLSGRVYFPEDFRLPGIGCELAYKAYKKDVLPSGGGAGLQKIIRIRESMVERQCEALDARTTWPLQTVVDATGKVAGILMRRIPEPYYFDRIQRSGNVKRQLRDCAYLLQDETFAKRTGLEYLDTRQRLVVMKELAGVLGMLHKVQVIYGDLSMMNVLFKGGDHPGVMLVDCDSVRIAGSATPFNRQPHSPDFDPPEAGQKARHLWSVQNAQTDVYKYGLMILRTFSVGVPLNSTLRKAEQIGERLPAPIMYLLEKTLDRDPAKRPSMKQWHGTLTEFLSLSETTAARKTSHADSQTARIDRIDSHALRKLRQAQQPERSAANGGGYYTGEIIPPFEAAAVLTLGDARAAILGSTKGTVAAVNLQSGNISRVYPAVTPRRAGGGENHYPAGFLFFLARHPLSNQFYTLGHEGVLQLWRLTGNAGEPLEIINSVPLLDKLRPQLYPEIKRASRKSSEWSHWSCYSSGVPDSAPTAIIDARMTADGQSILCLTTWFSVFLSSLDGVLRHPPKVHADAFTVAPGDSTGRTYLVGQGRLRHNPLSFRSFDNKSVSTLDAGLSWGREYVFLTPDGRVMTNSNFLATDGTKSSPSDMHLEINWTTPPVWLDSDRFAAPFVNSRINIYSKRTGRLVGDPLLLGHNDDVLSIDSVGPKHLISVSRSKVVLWDLDRRRTLSSPSAAMQGSIRHSEHIYYKGRWDAGPYVIVRCYAEKYLCVDVAARKCSVVEAPAGVEFWWYDNASSQLYAFGFEAVPAATPKGFRSMIRKLVDSTPRFDHRLAIFKVVGKTLTRVGATEIFLTSQMLGGVSPYEISCGWVGSSRIGILATGYLSVFEPGSLRVVGEPQPISPIEGSSSWYLHTQFAASSDGQHAFVSGPRRTLELLAFRPSLESLSLQPFARDRNLNEVQKPRTLHTIPNSKSVGVVTDDDSIVLVDASGVRATYELVQEDRHTRKWKTGDPVSLHACAFISESIIACAEQDGIRLVDLQRPAASPGNRFAKPGQPESILLHNATGTLVSISSIGYIGFDDVSRFVR